MNVHSLDLYRKTNYTPFRDERDNLFRYFSLMKSSENEFHFLPAF